MTFIPLGLINRSSSEDIRGMIEMCNKWLTSKGHEDKPVCVSNPLEMVGNGKENHKRRFVKLLIENCERVLKERHEEENSNVARS